MMTNVSFGTALILLCYGFHDYTFTDKCKNFPWNTLLTLRKLAYVIFHSCKNDKFQIKNCDIFLFLLYFLIFSYIFALFSYFCSKTLIVGTR